MHKLQNITLENNLSDLVIAGERPPWTLKILFSISADKPPKKLGQCQVGTHPFHFLVCVMGNVQAVRILLLVAGDAPGLCLTRMDSITSYAYVVDTDGRTVLIRAGWKKFLRAKNIRVG